MCSVNTTIEHYTGCSIATLHYVEYYWPSSCNCRCWFRHVIEVFFPWCSENYNH